jgi:hypothetical protein
MELLFAAISLSLFFVAVLTMVLIVRDALPLLKPEDQSSLRNDWIGSGFRAWRGRDRAIGRAWNEHARSFPKSRKRAIFSWVLILSALSVLSYPLWLALGRR